MKRFWLLFLFVLPAFIAVDAKKVAPAVSVDDLRAEYQINPIGIDYAPQLSWKLFSKAEGTMQTAYRILVASSEAILAEDRGDIWDSGKVESSKSTCIGTEHIKMLSRARYYWKVMVWQQDGKPSEWSQPAFWEMGLLNQNDWQGGWIGYVPGMPGRVLYFKANFWPDPSKQIAYSRLYAAGIGNFEVYINHKKLGDHVLDPAQSTYTKRVYYETYDVGALFHEGANTIVIPVAPGWMGSPRLRAQLEVVYTDGTCYMMNTDSFRHVTTGPTTYATIFDGESYDAREDKDYIWEPGVPAGLMDKQWAWAHNTDDPTGKMCAARVEPIQIVEVLKPTFVAEPKPGVYTFDAGRNLAGWVAIKVRGKEGDTVRLFFAETLREDGSVNQDNLRNAKSNDNYTCRGDAEECWEPAFTYHGFRYFQVEGLGYKPAAEDFTVKVVRTGVRTIGQFACADPLVNDIHRIIVNTESSNLHSVPTDCPQRDERMGWLNDLTVSHEIAAYNYDMARFFSKFAQDITDTQDEEGTITCVAPFRFGMRPADPVSASYLLMPFHAYEFYGNRHAIADNFEGMRAWTDYLRSRTKDGIVQYSYYGDWCPPRDYLMDPNGSGVSRDTPGLLMSTGYLFLCESLISKMAAILDMPDVAAQYKAYADATRSAFQREYWREDVGGYAANNQACNAFALYLGIPDEKQAARAVANLVADVRDKGHHLTTGNLCTKYVLDVLANYGYVDDAWKIVTQTTYPSWGFMLSKGATTVWERWEYLTGDAMNSHNHPMMASVDAWFYRYLLGIEPVTEHPGFEQISLKPYPPAGLEWAQGSLETVKGTVGSAWKRSGRNFIWTVDIPANTKADVSVPAAKGSAVTVNGKRVKTTQEAGYATFSLGGGHYEIKSKI